MDPWTVWSLAASLWVGGVELPPPEIRSDLLALYEGGAPEAVLQRALGEPSTYDLSAPDLRCVVGLAARDVGQLQLAASLLVGWEGEEPAELAPACAAVAQRLEASLGEVTFTGEGAEAHWIHPLLLTPPLCWEAMATYEELARALTPRPLLLPVKVWLPVGTWILGGLNFEVHPGEPNVVEITSAAQGAGPPPAGGVEGELARARASALREEAPRPAAPRGVSVTVGPTMGASLDPLLLQGGTAPILAGGLLLGASRELDGTRLRVEVAGAVGLSQRAPPPPESAPEVGLDLHYEAAVVLSRRSYLGGLSLAPGVGLVTLPLQTRAELVVGCEPELPLEPCVVSESAGGASPWWWAGVGVRGQLAVGLESWGLDQLRGVFVAPAVDVVRPVFDPPVVGEMAPRLVLRPSVGVRLSRAW